MNKKVIIIVVAILMIIFIFKIFKSDNTNILVFSRDTIPGIKDERLTGYFSNNVLEKFEISYYVEYENETFAKDDYDRLMYWQNPETEDGDDIKHTYTLKGNCLYTTISYIIKSMDSDIVKKMFETSNTSINKNQFKNYAKKQGYTK